MAGSQPERFNIWAAYVDLFSNMLALILMVGLVAAASGGAASGSRHACATLPAAPDDLTESIYTLAKASGLSDPYLEPGNNCEVLMLPDDPKLDSKWLEGSAFLRFETGSARFCWLDRYAAGRGCHVPKPRRTWPQLMRDMRDRMNSFCVALKNTIDIVADFDSDTERTSGFHVAIVGHTSDDWKPNPKDCSNGTVKKSAAGNARLVCNYQLSLQRAQAVLAYCQSQWGQTLDHQNVLTLGGESYLSSAVLEAAQDTDRGHLKGDCKSSPDRPEYCARERMVTVSVYTPGGHL